MFAEMAGELLPLKYKDEMFSVLNITECIECLDSERSEWHTRANGSKLLVRPFFRAERLPASTLFKSAHSWGHFFCVEYSGDPKEEFKACVEHEKLTGLLFKEVMIG
jgi:hypothetical protein